MGRNRMKIKLCGMMRLCDIEYANEAMPDYAGFVFAATRRYVDRKTALEFRKRLNPEIKSVGVYVNEPFENVLLDYREGIIDIAQLHGDEDAAYIEGLRKEADGLKLIKAVRVRSKRDVEESLGIKTDYLLYDTYVKGLYGGSGESFNWELLEGVDRPYFLAGGLNAGNIGRAAVETGAYALDISSGIETDGVKDRKKMLEAVAAVRRAENG